MMKKVNVECTEDLKRKYIGPRRVSFTGFLDRNFCSKPMFYFNEKYEPVFDEG